MSSRSAFDRLAWAAFAAWSAIILALTVPWTDFVGHTHWGKVQWIPFLSPPVKLIDIVVNIALYFPFGYALARASRPRGRVWHSAVLAALLSIGVEWSQLYSHSRFPSVQDVLCDVLGAWAGARLANRNRRALFVSVEREGFSRAND